MLFKQHIPDNLLFISGGVAVKFTDIRYLRTEKLIFDAFAKLLSEKPYEKITVQDTQAPIIVGVPADITIECDQPIPTNNVKTIDKAKYFFFIF